MAPADTPSDLREALPVFVSHASPRLLLAAFAAAARARVWLGGWSRWDLAPPAVIAARLAAPGVADPRLHPAREAEADRPLHLRRAGAAQAPRPPPRSRGTTSSLFIPFHSFGYALPLLAALCLLLTPAPELALTALAAYLLLALHYECGALPGPHARRAAGRLLPARSGATTGCTTSRTSTTGSG